MLKLILSHKRTATIYLYMRIIISQPNILHTPKTLLSSISTIINMLSKSFLWKNAFTILTNSWFHFTLMILKHFSFQFFLTKFTINSCMKFFIMLFLIFFPNYFSTFTFIKKPLTMNFMKVQALYQNLLSTI